jgi:hypothetical protein
MQDLRVDDRRLASSSWLTLIVIPSIYAVAKGIESGRRAWPQPCGKRDS